jgi:hypothetical protein
MSMSKFPSVEKIVLLMLVLAFWSFPDRSYANKEDKQLKTGITLELMEDERCKNVWQKITLEDLNKRIGDFVVYTKNQNLIMGTPASGGLIIIKEHDTDLLVVVNEKDIGKLFVIKEKDVTKLIELNCPWPKDNPTGLFSFNPPVN